MSVTGFRHGDSLKDYLVRAKLPKFNEGGRLEPCGKKSCLVCDSISTATTIKTEACKETSKVQSGPLSYDAKNVLYLLTCKVPYFGKQKPNSVIKINIVHLKGVVGKFLRNSSHSLLP